MKDERNSPLGGRMKDERNSPSLPLLHPVHRVPQVTPAFSRSGFSPCGEPLNMLLEEGGVPVHPGDSAKNLYSRKLYLVEWRGKDERVWLQP